MRRILIALALTTCAFVVSAQWQPRVVTPPNDPAAFKITTQADLEDALSRIARMKASLRQAKDEGERKFLLTSIIERCQNELNRDVNTSGVVVVERADENADVPDLALRWQGAFSAIEDQIRSLGEPGMKLYEELYGPRVQVLLADALRTRDHTRLGGLNRRFGLTRAGAQSAVMLANMLWEEGKLSQAARMIERALEHASSLPPPERAHLYAWLSHCYLDRGERANLKRLIDESTQVHDAPVRYADAAIPLIELLNERLSLARDGTSDTVDRIGVQWIGGNYANTGLHERPSGYNKPAWTRALPPLAAGTVNSSAFMNYNRPLVSPYLPIFDGSVIYVNTGDQLVAYDLVSGTRGELWKCKPFPTLADNWRTVEPDPSLILPVSTYRGTVYAALENPLHTAYHSPYPDGMFNLYSHYPKVRRALCAVDGGTGRLLWKLGGEYEGDRVSTLNFLSAVVYEGVLYALASRIESQADIFLYALNPDNGDVIWNLRLCYGQQETTMFGRPAREPHPSLPCISGSLLYVCTNIGGVVAVDLNTRGLRWISRYEYMPRPVSKYTETYYRAVTWFNSPTIYTEHEGKAYIVSAPTDADMLFAMDAATGKVVWQVRREDAPLYGGRSLVGARGGSLIVAGDGGMRGPASSMLHLLDPATGKVKRTTRVTPLGRGSTLALVGRPSLASDSLLWPGAEDDTRPRIAEVNLDSLQTVQSPDVTASYGAAGFSVFAQHGVVFTIAGRDYARGNAQLEVRYDRSELLKTAQRELEAKPDDAEANLRLGMLTLRMGTRADGMRLIRRAYELADQPPPNTRARDQASHVLVEEYLALADSALAQRGYTEAMGHVAAARGFAVTRSQRTECFLREEKAVLGQASRADTLSYYRGIIRTNPDFGIGADPELPAGLYATIRVAQMTRESEPAEAVSLYHTLLGVNPRLQFEGTPLRALALDQLRALLKSAGREAFAQQELEAQELAAKPAPDDWRRVLERYPLCAASDTATFKLAEFELEQFRPETGAEMIRNALDEYPERARRDDLQVLMAVCYARAGQALRARLVASRMLRQKPDGKLTLLKREQTYEELLRPLLEARGAEAVEPLPRLPASLTEVWRRMGGAFTRLPAQPASGGRIYISDTSQTGVELAAIDVASGERAWYVPSNTMMTEVRRAAGATLFTMGQGFALYDDEGNERWSVATGGTPNPISLKGGMLVFGRRYYESRTRRSVLVVTALDVETGGEVWRRELDANVAHWIAQGAAGVHVLVQGEGTRLLLLDAETGELRVSTAISAAVQPAKPCLTSEHVVISDRDGRLHFFELDTLAPAGSHETKVRFPSLLEARGESVVVAGYSGAALFSLTAEAVSWRVDFPNLETLSAARVLKDVLVLGSRNSKNESKLSGFALADGKPVFSHMLPRENQNDRVDLIAEAAFDDGFAAVFVEQRVVDGRLKLWGFRLIALNSDGSERLRWEYRSEDNNATFAQLAVTEDCLALVIGRSVMVGFGKK